MGPCRSKMHADSILATPVKFSSGQKVILLPLGLVGVSGGTVRRKDSHQCCPSPRLDILCSLVERADADCNAPSMLLDVT